MSSVTTHLPRAGIPHFPRRRILTLAALTVAALALCAWAGPGRAADAADLAVYDSVVAAIRSQFFDPAVTRAGFDSSVVEHRESLAAPGNKADLAHEVSGLLESLRYHETRFYRRGQAPDYTPAFRFRTVREGLGVTSVQPGSDCERAGLVPGNIVKALRSELYGPRGSSVLLQVQSDVGDWSRTVIREGYTVPDPDFGWRTYDNGRVGHLAVHHLTDPQVLDSVMLVARACRELVLDMRDCTEVDVTVLHLLGYFAREPSVAGFAADRAGMRMLSMPLSRGIPPALSENTGSPGLFNPALSEHGILQLRVVPGARQTFEGSVVVLTGESTAGFAELVPAWFKREKRGRLVGRPTAGRGGLKSQLPVSSDWTLELPVSALFYADGRPVEDHGVDPSTLIQWGAADVHAGADPDVERALQLLQVDE